MDYHYEIIFIVAGLLDTYAICKIMGVFLGSRIKNQNLLRLSYVMFYIVTTIIHLVVDIPFISMLGNIFGLFLISLNYRYSYWKRILAVAFVYLLLGGIETLVVLISGYHQVSLFERGEYASVSGMIFIKIIMYIVALVLDKFKGIRSGEEVPVSYWCCIFFVPTASIFMILQSMNYEMLTYDILTINILLFLGINFFVFYLYEHLSLKITENAEHQMQIQMQESALKQYELMKVSMDSMQGIRHDLRNHIMAMKALVSCERYQELERYMDEMADLPELRKQYVETKNVILDSILNYKIFEAEKAGVTIVSNIQFPSDFELNPYDFTVIFGNLLDNAVESSKSKIVQLKVRFHKGCMSTKIENDFEGVLSMDSEKRMITSKADKKKHGKGIKNVEKIIEKYNGCMEVEVKNQNFTVYVILYMN